MENEWKFVLMETDYQYYEYLNCVPRLAWKQIYGEIILFFKLKRLSASA